MNLNLKVLLMVSLMGTPAMAAERLTCTPFSLSVTTPNGIMKLPHSEDYPVKVSLIQGQLVFYPHDASPKSFACERDGDTSTCSLPGDVMEYRHTTRFLFRTANYEPGQTIVAQFTCKPRA
jgi:hypothetical protein